MDAYRAIHGPAPECKTWPFLYRILNTAQPTINIDKASIHHIHEREPVKFFPQCAIKDIFNPKVDENPVEQILKCRCSTCTRCEALKPSELEKVGGKIIKSSTTLLAILIYIGHGYLIKYFGPNDRASDVSLDSVTSHLQHEENLETSKRILYTDDVGAFCDIYNSARDIFQPPTFDLGGPTAPYGRSYRMPFLRDEPHAQGASGKVRKFNIHDDYLGKGIKDADWYRNSKSEVSTRSYGDDQYESRCLISTFQFSLNSRARY